MEGKASGLLAGPANIAVFSDRPASTDLEAFEWNASMDLLACLTAPPDSTLSIYRLLSEEQGPKLLSEKITGIGTTLAWSPCGRKIAVGDRLGSITIYDGETGTALHSKRLHSRPLASLSWSAAAGGAEALPSEPPWAHMLPPLLPVPSAPSNMYTEQADGETQPRGGEALGFLTSADEGGLVIVSAGGSFPLLAAHLSDNAAGSVASAAAGVDAPGNGAMASAASAVPACQSTHLLEVLRPRALQSRCLRSARLSPDLRQLAVLFGPSLRSGGSSAASPATQGTLSPSMAAAIAASAEADDVAEEWEPVVARTPQPLSEAGTPAVPVSGAGEELVIVLDVRKLAVRRGELSQCTGMAEKLVSTATYAKQAVDTLAHVWRGAVDAFAGKMRGFSEAIQTYGGLGEEGDSIHEELLLTCCAGTPSEAVHAFLTRQTSPQQLLRLERTLVQALEYVNLIICTRLQVAGQHILTILHELHACAGWAQKFRALGLDGAPLRSLMATTQEFNSLTELLLLECSKARRFVRTLFQVLLRLAQRFSEQPTVAEQSGAAPSKENMDDLIMRLRARQSLELTEVTRRIGAGRGQASSGSAANVAAATAAAGAPAAAATAPAAAAAAGVGAGMADGCAAGGLESLTDAIQRLAAEASQIGDHIVTALSSQVSLLGCIPVHATSPWSLPAMPDELRYHAARDAAAALWSPRGLGGSTLSMSWESLGHGKGARLVLLWTGGSGTRNSGSDLHACRCWFPPSPPSAPAPLQLERARLCACAPNIGSGGRVEQGLHFVLCQLYDASHAATLVLQSPGLPGSAIGAAAVCCVNIGALRFQPVPCLGRDVGQSIAGKSDVEVTVPPATYPEELPEDAVRRSAVLPEIYVWASAMRVMKSRGVCSVYAWRARRLLTLDMEAEADEENEDDAAE